MNPFVTRGHKLPFYDHDNITKANNKGSFKNYVDKTRWVGGSSKVNVTKKAYVVKMSTVGR